jgi:hypothetical protein
MQDVMVDSTLIVAANGWKTDDYASLDVDLWDNGSKWTGTGTYDVGFAIMLSSDVAGDAPTPAEMLNVKKAYITTNVKITDTTTTLVWGDTFGKNQVFP